MKKVGKKVTMAMMKVMVHIISQKKINSYDDIPLWRSTGEVVKTKLNVVRGYLHDQ